MKIACYVSVAIMGLFVVHVPAVADPSTDPENNTTLQCDPDGVPISLSQKQARQLSPEEIAEVREQRQQAAENKDWLLRGYEEQLKNHPGSSTSQGSNLYYELSSNKELAKLAGLPALNVDTPASRINQPGGVQSGQDSAPAEAAATEARINPSRGYYFKAFITPNVAGVHNFNSFLTDPVGASFYGLPSTKTTATAVAPSAISSDADIEMPGAISSGNGAFDPDVSDPDLEVLPGESIEHAKEHQDNDSLLQLPLPMDATQLHKQETESLSATNALPGTAQKNAPAQTTPAPTVPTEDPEAPTPVSKLPQINPVRAPIANPYDILNR
jgi:cell division septation protein DedD